MDDIQREDFGRDVREQREEERQEIYDKGDGTEVVYLGHEKDEDTFTSEKDGETHDPDSRKY